MRRVLQKVLVSLLVLGSITYLSAKEMYIFQTTDVKVDDKNATIYVGTPIKIVKKLDEKNVLVELSGLAFNNEVYTTKTKSLVMISKAEGSFGQKEQAVKVQAVIEKAYLSTLPSEIWEEHEEFFYEMCTQCHAAYKPNAHTMLEWDAILQTMSGFAQLYPDETQYLARFLKANASDGFYPQKE